VIKVLGLVAVALMLCAGSADAQTVQGKWGIGAYMAYNMPMGKYGERFDSEANKLGLSLNYVASSRVTMEVEYHYSKASGGALETVPFLWGVTNKEYISAEVFDDARHDIRWSSLLMSALVHFRAGRSMEEGSYSPYIVVGAGFYDHMAVSENILYPGQSETDAVAAGGGLDPSGLQLPAVVLPIREDSRTALAANVGIGMEMFLTRTIAVDVRARYHLVLSELRPFDQWLWQKAFPIQMVDVAGGLKFYFWD